MVTFLQNYAKLFCLLVVLIWLPSVSTQAQLMPLQEEENRFDQGKLDIVCQAIKFYLKANAHANASNGIECSSLESIEASIPEEYKATTRFFKLFKRKRYRSYGRGKLDRRLQKLIKDIDTELKKIRKDTSWESQRKRLMISLEEAKNSVVSPGNTQSRPDSTPTSSQEDSTNTVNNQPKTSTPKQTEDDTMSTVLSIVAILALGGLAYFFYQKMNELQQQIADLEEAFREKYSRLDNRLDMMTPMNDFRSVFPQIQQLNNEINGLDQEIQVLKTRNQFKISPQELYAKRTEHLETHHYSPEIQIYYAKFSKDENGFIHTDFKTEPSKENIYKLEVNVENPDEAFYQIVSRNEYHHLALNYEASMLAPANDYLNRPFNAYRIITKKPGKAQRENNIWVITEKAQLEFE
ncbi:hypothetical protein BKI52_16840 [marine bacterium AO1-C]|nr:hypothetical protein BKI52_16840 [marine bacterium AO1-C]